MKGVLLCIFTKAKSCDNALPAHNENGFESYLNRRDR